MDQVAEFSGESGFNCGVRFDNSEIGSHFSELVEVPLLEVCIGLTSEFSACRQSCDGSRDVRRGALLKRPEEEGLDRGTGEDCGGLPFAVRQGSVDGSDVVS